MIFDSLRVKDFRIESCFTEDKRCSLTGFKSECGNCIIPLERQRYRCVHRHFRTSGTVRLKMNTIPFSPCRVSIAHVVEARSAECAELDFSFDDAHHADDLMRINLAFLSGEDRHEIRNFSDTGIRKKTSQENICIWKIELLGTQILKLGLNAECAALPTIQQRREN